jgi:type IV secretory pathway VirB6-like protein
MVSNSPLFFAVIALLLGRHVIRFRRHMVVVLLVMYGLYGTAHLVSIHAWSMAFLPVATLVAASGVALRKSWPQYLVYVLSLLWVAQWSYYVWRAANSGYFRSSGVELSALSLMPGAAFLVLIIFCCYVVTASQPAAEIGSST